MISELINILENIKQKITDDSDVAWTRFDTAKEFRDELDVYINQLKGGDLSCLRNLDSMFCPTASLQEHSITNYWADEYIMLAKRFDELYEKMKRL